MRRLGWLVLVAAAAAQGPPEDPIAFTLSGSLYGTSGEPLAGVTVEAWDGLAAERYLDLAVTGAKGRFLIALRRSAVSRREHPFGPVVLLPRARGVAGLRQEVVAGARDVRLVAEPARTILGRVLDPGGRPVAGAVVRGRSPAGIREQTTADEEGRFSLVRFAASRGVAVEAYRDDVSVRARAVTKGGGKITLRLPAVERVAGVLVDAESGRPVAGARVLTGDMRVAAVADRQGRVRVAAGAAYRVLARGYRVAPFRAGEVRLERAAPLRGRVVDADDQPVDGCPVTVEADGLKLARRTGEFGRYEFAVVPPGLVRIRAERPGFRPASVRIASQAGAELTLRLLRGGLVAGRVLRDGTPAMGVAVSAFDAEAREVALAYSDAQGRFLMRGVALEARRLMAVGKGVASASVALPEIADGERAGPFRLDLKERLPLQGSLRSDADMPLQGVEVTCPEAGAGAVTDTDGHFRFESLPAREVELSASPPDHLPLRVRARPGLPQRLTATSRFGECVLEVAVSGAEVFDLALRRRSSPRVRRRGTWSGVERVRVEGLPAGTYDLEVSAAGCLPVSRIVELKEGGAAAAVRIALERGGTLRLLATPGASVAIFALRGKAPPVVALKLAGGAQTLRDFGPGRYRFLSRAPGELVVVKEIELGPQTPPRELDLRGGPESTLTVEVEDLTGAKLEGAEITLVADGGFSRRVPRRTDATGRLVLTRLFAGRMHVRVARGNRLGEGALDVTPGRALQLTVVVR